MRLISKHDLQDRKDTQENIAKMLEELMIDDAFEMISVFDNYRKNAAEKAEAYRLYRKKVAEKSIERWKDADISIDRNTGHCSDVIDPESLSDEDVPTKYNQNFFLSIDKDVNISRFIKFAKKMDTLVIDDEDSIDNSQFTISFYIDDSIMANKRSILCINCIRILLVDGQEDEYINFYDKIIKKIFGLFMEQLELEYKNSKREDTREVFESSKDTNIILPIRA